MFEKLITDSGYKQSFIAEKTGITEVRISFLKRNPSSMKAEEMVSLASFFAMTTDEFAEKIGLKSEPIPA